MDEYIKISYKDIDLLKITFDGDNILYNSKMFKIKTPVLEGKIIDNKIEVNNKKTKNYYLFMDKLTFILRELNIKDIPSLILDNDSNFYNDKQNVISIKELKDDFNFLAYIIIKNNSVIIDQLMKI